MEKLRVNELKEILERVQKDRVNRENLANKWKDQ